jgi:cbb3-type cytochrome oxidase subunit 3
MLEVWNWFIALASHKATLLALLFPLFIGIVIYTYAGRRRSQRLESYRYMPFEDEDEGLPPRGDEDGKKE